MINIIFPIYTFTIIIMQKIVSIILGDKVTYEYVKLNVELTIEGSMIFPPGSSTFYIRIILDNKAYAFQDPQRILLSKIYIGMYSYIKENQINHIKHFQLKISFQMIE